MNTWDQWIQLNALDGGFLQSTGWAEFQRGLGRKVVILAWPESVGLDPGQGQDDNGIRALVIEHRLPMGQTYVYSPRGPVVGKNQEELIRLISEIQQQFPRAIFWRIDPPDCRFLTLNSKFSVMRAPHNVQPATTLIIDLSKSEDELLALMKQKTRYNIRLAEKHGVRVASDQGSGIRDQFLDLLEETAKRDGFRIHAREHYQKLLSCRHCEPQRSNPRSDAGQASMTTRDCHSRHGLLRNDGDLSIELYGVFHNDQLLAGAIVAFFGKWAYYLHGASSNEHRDMMAPYLLHWEIMREAKRRGCTKYDFWGAGDEWPGVSKFKTGFAPETLLTQYPGTFDIVLRPMKYWAYRFIQRLR